jgi:hypothetical protein
MLYGDIGSRGGPTVIESFEDQDLSNYAGDTGSYGFSNDATDGSVSLENTAGSYGEIRTSSGLNATPSTGDTFRAQIKFSAATTGYAGLIFGMQDASNFYFARPRADNVNFELYRKENGSFTRLAESAVSSYSTSSWYDMEVRWGTGADAINADIYDDTGTQINDATLGTVDSTFTSGGIGWFATDSGHLMEYARII